MGVSDYSMSDLEETECPECGRTAAMVVEFGSNEKVTIIECFRCGYESEEVDEYEQGEPDEDEEEG